MIYSLYQKSREINNTVSGIGRIISEAPESNEKFGDVDYAKILGKFLETLREIDTKDLQGDLFKRYEENPVMDDAINGKISIEESLNELGNVVRPVRRLFPSVKNKAHNKNLTQQAAEYF